MEKISFLSYVLLVSDLLFVLWAERVFLALKPTNCSSKTPCSATILARPFPGLSAQNWLDSTTPCRVRGEKMWIYWLLLHSKIISRLLFPPGGLEHICSCLKYVMDATISQSQPQFPVVLCWQEKKTSNHSATLYTHIRFISFSNQLFLLYERPSRYDSNKIVL